MSSSVEGRLLYQLANAPLRTYPFPHLLVEEVFETDFYRRLRALLPDDAAYRPIAEHGRVTAGAYPARRVIELEPEGLASLPASLRVFWQSLVEALESRRLLTLLLQRFHITPPPQTRFVCSALLTRDGTGYGIGPHTDHPDKVLTLLFYLPEDHTQEELGTSLYIPTRPMEKDPGEKHFSARGFQRIFTTPYRPNTLFVFPRSDHSFHGVETIERPGVARDLLIFNLKRVPGRQDDGGHS